MDIIDKMAGAPMRWNDGNVVHSVEGTRDGDGMLVLWTLCHHDVPEGAVLDHRSVVTCKVCLKAT
jgi:hypothetical protein